MLWAGFCPLYDREFPGFGALASRPQRQLHHPTEPLWFVKYEARRIHQAIEKANAAVGQQGGDHGDAEFIHEPAVEGLANSPAPNLRPTI